jgi:hypothetical protein
LVERRGFVEHPAHIRDLRLSIERSRDREFQLRDVADGHAARRHELDGADLQEARGGDDVSGDLRDGLLVLART